MVDLLDLISNRLGFNYTVYEVADRNFGSKDDKGNWNGMVGELMKRDPSEVRVCFIPLRKRHVRFISPAAGFYN